MTVSLGTYDNLDGFSLSKLKRSIKKRVSKVAKIAPALKFIPGVGTVAAGVIGAAASYSKQSLEVEKAKKRAKAEQAAYEKQVKAEQAAYEKQAAEQLQTQQTFLPQARYSQMPQQTQYQMAPYSQENFLARNKIPIAVGVATVVIVLTIAAVGRR